MYFKHKILTQRPVNIFIKNQMCTVHDVQFSDARIGIKYVLPSSDQGQRCAPLALLFWKFANISTYFRATLNNET